MINCKQNYLYLIETSETISVKKVSSGLFKNVIDKMCLEIIYLIYMLKKDLALNNLQWLICQKTKPNQLLKYYSHLIEYQSLGL